MTKTEAEQRITESKAKCVIVAFPTGYGKSKLALDTVFNQGPLLPKVLVVHYRKVHKKNWIDEFKKWNYERHLNDVTFTTYESLHKYTDQSWDYVIFDECHHLSDNKLEIVEIMPISRAILLSATVTYPLIYKLKGIFGEVQVERIKTQEAIDTGVLPNPTIYLWELTLNIKDKTQQIIKNPKATKYTLTGEFSKRRLYKDKSTKYIIPCTEHQYHLDIYNLIEWYKGKSASNAAMRNRMLKLSNDLLKWLADIKTPYIKEILKYCSNQRTLTFCGSIEQTAKLSSNCIHHKNKDKDIVLNDFNSKRIKHITAVEMLDEGMNLVDCRVGIFAKISSSERLQVQRVGRILRHKDPIIIIPYYRDTREAEIVKDMIADFDSNRIIRIKSLEEIKL